MTEKVEWVQIERAENGYSIKTTAEYQESRLLVFESFDSLVGWLLDNLEGAEG